MSEEWVKIIELKGRALDVNQRLLDGSVHIMNLLMNPAPEFPSEEEVRAAAQGLASAMLAMAEAAKLIKQLTDKL